MGFIQRTCWLLLVVFVLFPPWNFEYASRGWDVVEPAGYHFIGTGPTKDDFLEMRSGTGAKIDVLRLLLQAALPISALILISRHSTRQIPTKGPQQSDPSDHNALSLARAKGQVAALSPEGLASISAPPEATDSERIQHPKVSFEKILGPWMYLTAFLLAFGLWLYLGSPGGFPGLFGRWIGTYLLSFAIAWFGSPREPMAARTIFTLAALAISILGTIAIQESAAP
jgi:hypothetical protein